TCGLALDQEQLATIRLALRAVCQFSRKASAIERTLAAGKIASFTRSPPPARGLNPPFYYFSRPPGVLFEIRSQALIHERLHDSGDVGIQLAFRLAFELRLRQFHADHRHQAFAHIVASQVFFDVLEQSQLLPGVVDGAGQRRAESRKMRATVDGVDVVCETEHGLGIAVVVSDS